MYDKEIISRIAKEKASKTDIRKSLELLIRVMQQHYGKEVIVLLDEYDVPLAKASSNGYYEEMLEIIRSTDGNGFKR